MAERRNGAEVERELVLERRVRQLWHVVTEATMSVRLLPRLFAISRPTRSAVVERVTRR